MILHISIKMTFQIDYVQSTGHFKYYGHLNNAIPIHKHRMSFHRMSSILLMFSNFQYTGLFTSLVKLIPKYCQLLHGHFCYLQYVLIQVHYGLHDNLCIRLCVDIRIHFYWGK
jgi:hypothetical protein